MNKPEGRAIAHETYDMFRRKYKITKTKIVKHVRVNKTLDEIKKEIYDYEHNNPDKITIGLYVNTPKEYVFKLVKDTMNK